MARPKKAAENKRGKPMSFRPENEAEEDLILEKVRKSGLTQSEFLRQAALRGRVVVKNSKTTNPELIFQLQKVGNNLNQLVHNVHIFKKPPETLPKILDDIERLVVQAAEEVNAE